MIERVHLVFKTHLDIGFTDLAAAVTERYLSRYIPDAIATAASLRRRGGRERLVWTTGAWLVSAYLDRAGAGERGRLEDAVAAGHITWHALPFTTHTELMDAALCDYGLSLSASLDRRFGRKTIAGKLTDVPGHTLGLVPLLARRGVRYLHIGVNGGSRVPALPPLFRWRAPSGEEILVHYDGGYGSTFAAPGMTDALAIVNGQDNLGPPQEEEVAAVYRRLSEAFPGAEIRASTLDAFAASLVPFADSFPLVESEIGDSWIHGAGSDPAKVARYRELLRLRARWAADGRLDQASVEYRSFMGSLLMVPEHTWGLDFKKYLADYRNWSADNFAAARARDLVGPDAIPEELRFIEEFAETEYLLLFPHGAERRRRRTYSFFESAHAEQRAYVVSALDALPPSLRAEADAALAGLAPRRAEAAAAGSGPIPVDLEPGCAARLGPWTAAFAADGSLASLSGAAGRELAGPAGLGTYRYESFGPEDYDAWHRSYNRDVRANAAWLLPDFGKPGLAAARPRPERRLCAPVLRSLRVSGGEPGGPFQAEAVLAASGETPRGAPRSLVLRYRFHADGASLEVALDWFDKEAVRLPEALWLSFDLAAAAVPAPCRMVKLGLPLDPADTVGGGARHIHAVEALLYPGAELRPLDSPLVSFGERKLLRYDDLPAATTGPVHCNLYNNVWGTNFPLWYGEDGRSRFLLNWVDMF